MYDFLGVGDMPTLSLADEHVGSYSKPMSDAVRDRLRRLYRPHHERLFQFLGFRIPEWEDSPAPPPSLPDPESEEAQEARD